MPDPVTLTFSALSLTTALAVRVGCWIADLEAAGDEFHDLRFQFRQTDNTLSKLRQLFAEPGMPKCLVEEYTRDLQLQQNELEDIDVILQEITRKLNDSTVSGMFAKITQKNALAYGDLNRLTNRLQFFNQNLMNLLATHHSRLLLEVHRNVVDVKKMSKEVNRGMRIDMGVRYGSHVVATMQNDGWGDDSDGTAIGQSSWTYEQPPRPPPPPPPPPPPSRPQSTYADAWPAPSYPPPPPRYSSLHYAPYSREGAVELCPNLGGGESLYLTPREGAVELCANPGGRESLGPRQRAEVGLHPHSRSGLHGGEVRRARSSMAIAEHLRQIQQDEWS